MLGAANAIGRKSEAEIVKQPSTGTQRENSVVGPFPLGSCLRGRAGRSWRWVDDACVDGLIFGMGWDGMAGRLQCACHVNTRSQQTNIDGRRLGAHLRAVRPRIGRLATGLRPGEPWKAPSLPSRKTPLNHPSFLRRLPHYDSKSIHSALSSKCHHHQLQETWGNAVCASPAWQNILSRRRRR